MTAALPIQVSVPSLAIEEQELILVLESSLYPGAKPESIKLVIAYCRAAQLDPMLKPVHIVPMKVKQKKRDGHGFDYVWRDVVMPGIELYRIRAARTGEYVGMDAAKWGEEKSLHIGTGPEFKYPEWCEVTVYRLVAGQPRAFNSGRVRFLETYATQGQDDDGNKSEAPNRMWKKRPYGQLEKCAEALALRRAFPELGAAPTAEEMEGKVIDADVVVEPARPMIEQPRAKTESATPASASTTATAGSADPAAATPAGGGGAPDQKDAPPMKPSQVAILKAKLSHAALTETDLEVAFAGKSLEPKAGKEMFTFADFGAVQDWISKNSKA